MADGSLAGTARQNYVPDGSVTVGFTPDPDAPDQIAALTEQLETQLREYRAEIAGLVKPWSDEWAAAQSWGAKIALLQDARDRGLTRGASAWGHDQVGFLQQVGGWASDAGSWIVGQGEDLVDWYSDLPMLGKVFPVAYAAGEGVDAAGDALEDASEEIQRLWVQREALFEFFKALYEQSVNAVQITIETLAAMGGELGELMQAMWDQGAEWVQGLIEMCRESEILQKIFASVGALFAALPPNLWAEGIGTGVGYIVPELLISVVLAVLAAISAGAGAAALAARLLGYGAKLREALAQHGRLGRVLLAVYDGIGNLADNIAALVRALWRNISESVEGAVDRTNRVLRRSRRSTELSPRQIREIIQTPKGQRPDPETYLSSSYIAQHLEQFDSGAVRVVSKSNVEKYGSLGPPGGLYVFPKQYVDDVVTQSNGNLRFVEEKLGLPTDYLASGDIQLAEINDVGGLRMPSGNELGANTQWLPGGKTSGGIPEAIIDPPDMSSVSFTDFRN